MKKDIESKIEGLNPQQRKLYNKTLVGIYEWKEDCMRYGAKDPVGLPNEDRLCIMKKLYQELFG